MYMGQLYCHIPIHVGGAMKCKIIYIAAVVVIALISGIPIAYGQEDCPDGAEFIISFDNIVNLAEFQQSSRSQSHLFQECLEIY